MPKLIELPNHTWIDPKLVMAALYQKAETAQTPHGLQRIPDRVSIFLAPQGMLTLPFVDDNISGGESGADKALAFLAEVTERVNRAEDPYGVG